MTTVRDLVARLDAELPFRWAEEWDRVGLLVGDADDEVARVLVSLDPTLAALQAAVDAGANVLVTHHPVFRDPLGVVTAEDPASMVVYAAISNGVALANCHTNLDRDVRGADALPRLLALTVAGPLEPLGADVSRPRMGRICRAAPGTTLGELAAHVSDRLGAPPRVWGDPDRIVERVAVAPGSGASFVSAALGAGCDVMLTGELRYHGALAALDSGLAVIEAGHDATEWPLVAVLADVVAGTEGLSADRVVLDPTAYRWWTA